jgi:hypothetical protein
LQQRCNPKTILKEISAMTNQNEQDTEVKSFTTFLESIANRKFELGRIVATPGAMESCPPSRRWHCLASHARGDWGCVCKEDAASNDEAVETGLRILSAYPINPAEPSKGYGANTLWIITEADRSATTFLLPDEY